MKELTHKEMSAKGGTNRWKGTTEEQRVAAMKELADKRIKKFGDGWAEFLKEKRGY